MKRLFFAFVLALASGAFAQDVVSYQLTINTPTLLDLGSVTVENPSEDGLYAEGTTVKITASAAADATFVRWYGSVPAEQAFNAELTLTMDAAKTIYPYFKHDWVLDTTTTPATMTDGYWKIRYSGARDSISLVYSTGFQKWDTVVATGWAPGFCDFTKPISGGGKIVSIGTSGFKGATSLKELLLPDTITSIGQGAFYNCSNLKSISPFVSPLVTSIGKEAFFGCAALASPFTFGGDKTKTYTTGSAIFSRCKSIPSATFLRGVTALNANDFGSFKALKDITFLCDMPTIHNSTFDNDGSAANQMIHRVHLPKDMPKWKEFIEQNVTPWSEVLSDWKKRYTTNHGANAPVPDGMIYAGTEGLGGMRRQAYFGFTSVQGSVLLLK